VQRIFIRYRWWEPCISGSTSGSGYNHRFLSTSSNGSFTCLTLGCIFVNFADLLFKICAIAHVLDYVGLVVNLNHLWSSGCRCPEGKQRWFAWEANHDSCSAITLGGSSCVWNASPCCPKWWRDCWEGLLAMGLFVDAYIWILPTVICAFCT